MKRFLLCLLTLSMLAFLFVPQADARRRCRRGRRYGRGYRGRRTYSRHPLDRELSGMNFFGKRRTVKGFEGIKIEPSDRPGAAEYVFNSDYLVELRNSLNEALTK